jgi:cytochrome c551/c552
VLAGEQVLVCPDCQAPGWTDALDRCASCGSTALVKRLGEVGCRGCGAVDSDVAGPGFADPAYADPSALADEVAAALDRVLRGD